MESRLRGHSGKFSRLSYKHSRVRSIPPSLLLFATSNIYTYIPYRCLSDGVSKRHAQQCRNPWAFNKRTIDNTAWRGVDWKNAALRDRDKLKPGWRFDCRPRPIYLLRSIFAPLDPLSPLSPLPPLSPFNVTTGRFVGGPQLCKRKLQLATIIRGQQTLFTQVIIHCIIRLPRRIYTI